MAANLPQTTPERSVGSYRVVRKTIGDPHPADGMTAVVQMGGGAASSIINPQSFEDGGVGWNLTWGNVEGVRYTAASLLESYDYLLSGAITMAEATRWLRLLRNARKKLANAR